LERGTGTAREAGVGVAGGCVAGFLRRASFPEGRAAKDGTLVDPSLDGSDMFGGRRFSESESELTRKGSNELEAGFLLWWANDWEELKAVPSTCEEGGSGGEGWRSLLRRPWRLDILGKEGGDVRLVSQSTESSEKVPCRCLISGRLGLSSACGFIRSGCRRVRCLLVGNGSSWCQFCGLL
jgi:hypothetical protein